MHSKFFIRVAYSPLWFVLQLLRGNLIAWALLFLVPFYLSEIF